MLHLTTFVPHCLNCNVPLLREHQNLCILLLVLRVAVARCVRVFNRAGTTVQRGRRGDLERSSGEASVARDTRVRLDGVLTVNLWSTSCYREDGGPRTDIRSVSHHDQSNGSDRSFLDEFRPGQRDAWRFSVTTSCHVNNMDGRADSRMEARCSEMLEVRW